MSSKNILLSYGRFYLLITNLVFLCIFGSALTGMTAAQSEAVRFPSLPKGKFDCADEKTADSICRVKRVPSATDARKQLKKGFQVWNEKGEIVFAFQGVADAVTVYASAFSPGWEANFTNPNWTPDTAP